MDIEELFWEFNDREDDEAWFYSSPGPVNESGHPTTLILLLERIGGEIARCEYRPAPDLQGWKVTMWPRDPFYPSLPLLVIHWIWRTQWQTPSAPCASTA